MNKKISFKIDNEKNINELNRDLSDFQSLKIKFLQKSNTYNKEQKNNFWHNFYDAKLNTMLSILNYHVDNNDLNNTTNPFIFETNSKKEAFKYSERICHLLSELDIDIISETEEMTDSYENLINTIESSSKTLNTAFLTNNNFWNEFMKFNKQYYNVDSE